MPKSLLSRAKAFEAIGGGYDIMIEVGCINGLSAWFTIATVHEPEYAEMMMTEGALPSAEEVAAAILGNSWNEKSI
jgi:hypothetical protein